MNPVDPADRPSRPAAEAGAIVIGLPGERGAAPAGDQQSAPTAAGGDQLILAD